MEPEKSTPIIRKELSPARDLLLNRIFLGCYEERRYVMQLEEYRDVVTISSAESELQSDLDAISEKLKGICGIKWLGITGPNAECSKRGYRLWVKLTNVPFGYFWFQIKEIKSEYGEIILRLKCLRPLRPEDYEGAYKNIFPKSEDSKNSEDHAEYSFDFDPVQKITMLWAAFNDILRQVRPHITWDNFGFVSRLIFAMAFVLISALLTSIRYIGDYFIRLVRELTALLHVLTPVFVQAIDCFSKIIGGVFILIALMFRGSGTQQLQNQLQSQSQRKTVYHPQQYVYKLMSAPPVQEPDFSENRPLIIPKDGRERN